jgi:hypothetical protein
MSEPVEFRNQQNKKVYKLYYNEPVGLVTVDDNCHRFEFEYSEDEPILDVINRFEDMIEDKEEADSFLSTLTDSEE